MNIRKRTRKTSWRRSLRRGSYIVEAAIVMPIFIAATVALMSLVPTFAACENLVFSAADEMRMESVKSAFRKNPAALPVLVKNRICGENPRMDSCQVIFYRYLYQDNGIEDLLLLDLRAAFSENSPAGVFDAIRFDARLKGRAFTGKIHKTPPGAGQAEDDTIVYVFPQWGTRYHGKHCTYIKANCQMVYLSQDTKKGYTPCSLCNASFAQIGSPVFCFTESGRVYHLAECRVVERYYVEMEKGKAISQGYTPCSKCGGE